MAKDTAQQPRNVKRICDNFLYIHVPDSYSRPHKYVHSQIPLGTTFLAKVAGVALVVESFRRRSHPHVWFLNGPIVLLYAIDHLVCSWLHRWGKWSIHYFATSRIMLRTVVRKNTPTKNLSF